MLCCRLILLQLYHVTLVIVIQHFGNISSSDIEHFKINFTYIKIVSRVMTKEHKVYACKYVYTAAMS